MPSAFRFYKILYIIFFLVSFSAYGQLPSPEDFFGFRMGADYKIADYTEIVSYLQMADEKSDRATLRQIGATVLGKPMYVMFISSEENLKQLDKWRNISEKLSRARIGEAEARQLAQDGKAIIWIDGGIHSSEKAGTQFPPELAYDIITGETSEIKKIRENVILMLMPNINPDGLDIVANWYKKNLGTPYETTNPPVLYHYYVGHDDNRDWFMNTQPETRAVTHLLFKEWYPQIVHNQHQTSPSWARIFIPPFSKPVNPNIHPGVVAGVNIVGNAMASRFATHNMPGAVSDVSFTMWWNGGLRTAPYFHNQIGILTETAHATPTPRFYPPDSLPKTIGNGIPTDGTAINYAFPWKGGESRFRDAVEYMLTAAMATLTVGSDMKEKLLYDIYNMGKDAIEASGKDDAFAYVIPHQQWDRGEAVNLVNVLLQGGIEIEQASKGFEAEGKQYEAGTFVIYGAQPFRPYVKDLLEKQSYPDIRLYPGGPPKTPYDLAGWTLPYQMGVTVKKIADVFHVKGKKLADSVAVEVGEISGTAEFGYALTHQENNSALAVNCLLRQGESVYWASKDFDSYNAGTILIKKGDQTESRLQSAAAELGLTFTGIKLEPENLHQIQQPKVGLYKSWVANMDEGWTRWLLDQYDFEYDTLHDEDIRTKDLSQYHAIIIPDQHPIGILHGHAPNSMPDPYTGGLGLDGALRLEKFVKHGGTLITFDEASDFAIAQFGLPVKNVTKGLSSSQFFIPGSIIRTAIDTSHLLAYGMQAETGASFNNSRAFEMVVKSRKGEGGNEDTELAPKPPVEVIARYAKKDLLMSGWALGANKYIAGKAAMMRVQHGQGNIILFGFRPQFRGQPRGTYKLIFNALYSSTIDGLPAININDKAAEE